MTNNVHLITSSKLWIEGSAIEQLHNVANRPGIIRAVGMPDIHPAKGAPNGAAFLSHIIYPDLVGTDDGCGMSLWVTDVLARKAKLDKLIDYMDGLDQPWDGDATQWLTDRGIEPTGYESGLGTPGFGNHFIEIQQVEKILDAASFDILGMSENHLHLTVHSGSRGFGESIMMDYSSQFGAKGVEPNSIEGQKYLKQNEHAISWAVANRQLCAKRALDAIGADGKQILDICHNSVSETFVDGCCCWLHRKGAAPSDKGAVIIPGSRNALSYVVMPIEGESLKSLAHGAGRRINRSDAAGKLANYYRGKDMRQNQFGGRLICGQKNLLWEEAPECYKPINTVIDSLVEANLIHIIATLKPILTFKTSETFDEQIKQDRKQREKLRSQQRQEKRR